MILGLAVVVFIGLKVSGLQLMKAFCLRRFWTRKPERLSKSSGYSASAADHAAMYSYDTDFTDYVHENSKPRPDWPKVLAQRPRRYVLVSAESRLFGTGPVQHVHDARRRHL